MWTTRGVDWLPSHGCNYATSSRTRSFVCLFRNKEFLPTMEHILLGSALAGLVRYVAGQDGENIVMSEFDAVRIGTSLLTRA